MGCNIDILSPHMAQIPLSVLQTSPPPPDKPCFSLTQFTMHRQGEKYGLSMSLRTRSAESGMLVQDYYGKLANQYENLI